MIIEILLICITSIVIAYIYRPSRSSVHLDLIRKNIEEIEYRLDALQLSSYKTPHPHQMPDYPMPEMTDYSVMTDDREPYNISDEEEVAITNYYDGLGSDYLREVNEEFDERIKQIEAELEYEKREQEKVLNAKEAVLSDEDAELLKNKLAAKVKEEYAQ